jgi:hypothetical protein
MRTVLCIAAIAVVSFVPVSAQQQQTTPPASAPRPATAPTTPPAPTVKPQTAPVPTLPATPSRTPPAVAAPSVGFELQSVPTPAQGQQGQQGGRGQGAPRPAGTPQGATAPAPAASQTTSWQNVRLEIKISDWLTPGPAESSKVVSMLILDGRNGQVRSTSDSGVINVDAHPTIRPDGRIYLQLGLEYRPELTSQQAQQTGNSRVAMYNETLNLIVTDGKPILASQSADPRTDRKVVVEITASVIK